MHSSCPRPCYYECGIGTGRQAPAATGSLSLDQLQNDYLRQLRQAPAITELSQLDSSGREQLRVSPLAMNLAGSKIDDSHEPKFREAQARTSYFSPVYFRSESEPYPTRALAERAPGARITVAEVNLKSTATAEIPIVIPTSKMMTTEETERSNGQINHLAQKAEFDRASFLELVRGFCTAPVARV